jgi:hypothetical protein
MAHAGAVAMAMILLAAGPTDRRTAVALVELSAADLRGCDADDLESALRRGIGRRKRVRLAESQDAPLSLKVVECRVLEQETRHAGYQKKPKFGDGGRIVASEQVVEVGRESEHLRPARAVGRRGTLRRGGIQP